MLLGVHHNHNTWVYSCIAYGSVLGIGAAPWDLSFPFNSAVLNDNICLTQVLNIYVPLLMDSYVFNNKELNK